MPKRIQVSSDDVTYYTLPGNTAELRNEAGQLVDTIFGQTFESNEVGLISGSINANALYKGFAGYIVSLLKGGTPTTMTAEPMSLVSGKTYRITAATKRIIDVLTAVTVKGNGVAISASNIESIDFLFGTVTFISAYTPTTPITMDGKYIPTTAIAGARSFNLTQTMNPINDSDIPTVKANGGYATFNAEGLRTVSLEVGGIFKTTNAFRTALANRENVYVSINPDNADLSTARGLFKIGSQGQSGDVGALEEETVNLNLSVRDEATPAWLAPFRWDHAASPTLNAGVRALLAAWQNSTKVYVKYLWDGTVGFKSDAVVTEISLQGGIENMNEFSVGLQLSGAPTAIP